MLDKISWHGHVSSACRLNHVHTSTTVTVNPKSDAAGTSYGITTGLNWRVEAYSKSNLGGRLFSNSPWALNFERGHQHRPEDASNCQPFTVPFTVPFTASFTAPFTAPFNGPFTAFHCLSLFLSLPRLSCSQEVYLASHHLPNRWVHS